MKTAERRTVEIVWKSTKKLSPHQLIIESKVLTLPPLLASRSGRLYGWPKHLAYTVRSSIVPLLPSKAESIWNKVRLYLQRLSWIGTSFTILLGLKRVGSEILVCGCRSLSTLAQGRFLRTKPHRDVMTAEIGMRYLGFWILEVFEGGELILWRLQAVVTTLPRNFLVFLAHQVNHFIAPVKWRSAFNGSN